MSATCKLLQYDNDPIDRLRLLKLSVTLRVTLLPCLQGHSLIVECPQSCTRCSALHLTRIDNLEKNLFQQVCWSRTLSWSWKSGSGCCRRRRRLYYLSDRGLLQNHFHWYTILDVIESILLWVLLSQWYRLQTTIVHWHIITNFFQNVPFLW